MGWASGSQLLTDVISTIEELVDDKTIRKDIYTDFIEIFQNYDCDTLDECTGSSDEFDAAYKEAFGEEEVEDGWSDDED